MVDDNIVPNKFKRQISQIKNYIKNEPKLDINGQIQFSNDFILDVINTIKSFFKQLFDSIE